MKENRQNTSLTSREASDFVRSLVKMVSLVEEEDKRYSNFLKLLERSLRATDVWLVEDVAKIIQNAKLHKDTKTESKRNKKSSDEYNVLLTASIYDLRKIIEETDVQRSILLRLGVERLGMAKSKLQKSYGDALKREVLAALSHEISLKVISESASRGGRKRGS